MINQPASISYFSPKSILDIVSTGTWKFTLKDKKTCFIKLTCRNSKVEENLFTNKLTSTSNVFNFISKTAWYASPIV